MPKRKPPTKGRKTRLFDAIEDVLASLPTNEDRAAAAASLDDLLTYLRELREKLASFPTREEMTSVSDAITRCRDLFDADHGSSILASMFTASPPRARAGSRLQVSDPERIEQLLRSLQDLTVDQLRERLISDRSISQKDLFGIARSLQLRPPAKTSRVTLAHQVTTALSNRRGYDHLSGSSSTAVDRSSGGQEPLIPDNTD
jgi:hypothetical protein